MMEISDAVGEEVKFILNDGSMLLTINFNVIQRIISSATAVESPFLPISTPAEGWFDSVLSVAIQTDSKHGA